MAFRGVGKSWITAAYVLWCLYRNPQTKILVVSASSFRAGNFTTFCLDLIRSVPELSHLKPKAGQRESRLSFDVGPATPDQSPSVLSLGITSQIAGTRADLIVADDIEVPNNSDTQAKRDKLAEQVKEFDAVLKPNGKVVYLGTPQTEGSLYFKLQEAGYVIRIWPARYPSLEKVEKNRHLYAPMILRIVESSPERIGETAEPDRFSHDDLLERELSYGRAGFALQFMLDVSLSDADKYPLKLKDFIVHPLDPSKAPSDFMWASSAKQLLDMDATGLPGDKWFGPGWVSQEVAAYEGSVMFVDPSGRGKDETAYAVVKQLGGRLYLTAAGGYQDGYAQETLRGLLKVAKAQAVNHILIEPNFGGGMFSALLSAEARAIYPCVIEDAKWSQSSKEARIVDTLEPVLMQHRLVVCPSVIEADLKSVEGLQTDDGPTYRLFYQLTHITRDKGALRHDDRVDALAGAVGYWVDSMSRNVAMTAKERDDDAKDRMLDEWLQKARGSAINFMGKTPPKDRVFSSARRTLLRSH